METSFTPIAGLVGGGLIGLAATMMLLLNGKIAGISGILGNTFFAQSGDRAWRLTFLLGLPLGASIGIWLSGDATGFEIVRNTTLLAVGGVLVGIGTQLGNGCTSGHGVCGMSRGSRRSIVATVTFMTTAAITVFVMRHVVGGRVMRNIISLICGLVFGMGLSISGMTNPAKVLGFLDFFGAWDPTLAFVMGGALFVSTIGTLIVRGRERPWLAASFAIPTRQDVAPSLVTGASIFGVGWGLVGLCPGPALANINRGNPDALLFVAAMIVGIFAVRAFEHRARPALPNSVR